MAIETPVTADLGQIMDLMPYGLYIVGSRAGDRELNGMMADWVMQVSFKPRMLAVSFENDAHTLANVRDDRWFTVNFLPANDEGLHLAAKFAQPHNGSKILGRTEGEKAVVHHKMDGIPHAVAPHGSPVLNGAMAWLECRAEQFVPVGDHTMIIGEVVGGHLISDADPITSTFTGWTYSG